VVFQASNAPKTLSTSVRFDSSDNDNEARFSRPPSCIGLICSLDVGGQTNWIFDADVTCITRHGMRVHGKSWEDSVINSIEAVFIATEGEQNLSWGTSEP
jgi:hypothetical protein